MDELTEVDRLDLCDIAWFLKGMKQAGNCPFTNQDETLEKVIRYIARKIREDKAKGTPRHD